MKTGITKETLRNKKISKHRVEVPILLASGMTRTNGCYLSTVTYYFQNFLSKFVVGFLSGDVGR